MIPKRNGFTLIEVLVALLITALIATTAARLFATTVAASRSLHEARRAHDRRANARRWLAAAFLSLEAGTDSTTRFEGHVDHVVFGTWLLTAQGWMERRAVRIAQDGERLVATSGADTVTLADTVDAVAFDYLLTPGEESRWASEWVSDADAPIAVRVRVERPEENGRVIADTALYLIKERR